MQTEMLDELDALMNQGRWKASGVVSEYTSKLFSSLSSSERDRINDHMRRQLAGEEASVFQPGGWPDAVAGQLMWCVHDTLDALKRLDLHLKMISKNPFKSDLTDNDYIDIVTASFDSTCYVVNERLSRMCRALRKAKFDSELLASSASKILKTSKRRRNKKSSLGRTVFDEILEDRGTHTHVVNVERPHVSRIILLRNVTIASAIDRKLSLSEALGEETFRYLSRQAVRDARKHNRNSMLAKLRRVEAAADEILANAAPCLQNYFEQAIQKFSMTAAR